MPAEPSLLFCFDEAYAAQAAVAMASALRQANRAVVVYCFVPDLTDASHSRLAALADSHGATLQVIRVDATQFSGWHALPHIPQVTYLRLLAPTLIDAPKVLYLDCDLLVTEDWLPLFDTSLQGHWIGGVPDATGAATSRLPRHASDTYLNAGVLLMDLDALRHAGFTDQCIACYQYYGPAVTWLDQCLINKVCENRKLIISPRWNHMAPAPAMTRQRWDAEFSPPGSQAIVHFLGDVKPWMSWCPPYLAAYWWRFAETIDWPGLAPIPASNVDQLRFLAKKLDEDGDYQAASQLKDTIIEALLQHVAAAQRR